MAYSIGQPRVGMRDVAAWTYGPHTLNIKKYKMHRQ